MIGVVDLQRKTGSDQLGPPRDDWSSGDGSSDGTRADPDRGAAAPAARDGRDRRRQRLSVAALLVVTVAGALLRAHGLSSLGLYRDDAWVALSAHVGIGQAWRMWATAPGALFLDRTLLALGHSSTVWAQLPALVAGVAAIPVMYATTRCFRLGRLAALGTAGALAFAPLCIEYSSRVKEYELDLLAACLVLALGERARRAPAPARPVALLALASLVAFGCSASSAPVIVGVWAALAVATWRGPRRRWPAPVLAAAGATAVGCGALALDFYRHPSPALKAFWSSGLVTHASPAAFVSSVFDIAWQLLAFAVGLGQPGVALRVVLVLAWLGLLGLGLVHRRGMLAPALAVVVAFAASAARVAPLGTGRTDLYLYPALLLLLAGGATTLVNAVARRVEHRPRREVRALAAVSALVALIVAGVWVGQAWSTRPAYPGVDAAALAAGIRAHERPGDHVFVGELMRYPWALAEEARPDIRFGSEWAAGFSVASTQPDVFIAPSEFYEGGSDPKAWAARMRTFHRLWYVWSPPLRDDPSYAALRADGWRPTTTLHAPGGSATLLVQG